MEASDDLEDSEDDIDVPTIRCHISSLRRNQVLNLPDLSPESYQSTSFSSYRDGEPYLDPDLDLEECCDGRRDSILCRNFRPHGFRMPSKTDNIITK